MRRFSISCSIAIGVIASSVIVLDAREARAQHRSPLITTSVGVIRNLQTDGDESYYSIYPEVQFNARILSDIWDSAALDGSVYLGGWREGALSFDDLPDNCICDSVLKETHRSILLGARLGLSRMYGNNVVSLTTGLSGHFVWRTWAWAATRSAVTSTSRTVFFPVETGVRLRRPVSQVLFFSIGTSVFWYISGSEFGVDPRVAVTFSVSYVRRVSR